MQNLARRAAALDTKCFSLKIIQKIRAKSSRPDPRRREKINLNFYFHTSFWCIKRFYEGLEGITFILIQLSEMHGAGRINMASLSMYVSKKHEE